MNAVRKRFYEIFDVFTDVALAGNQLAIIHDADDLSDKKMTAIAREFNLSETVFVLPPTNSIHIAKLRIFNSSGELPFSGHPTIGSIISLALRREIQGDLLVTLEEEIGPIRCIVNIKENIAFAEFDLPKLPVCKNLTIEKETFASAFGVDTKKIGFENHVPSFWSAGMPFYFVPVYDLVVMANAKPDPIYIADNFMLADGFIPKFYLYCRETQLFQSAFHARMFRPDGSEDAATGAAASALCGVIHHFDKTADGDKKIWIEQGIEINRPSNISLEWEVIGSKITAARVGGNAIKTAEGYLFV